MARDGTKYDADLYNGNYGNFAREFNSLLDGLTDTLKKQIQGLVIATIRDALLGKLTPVTTDGYGDRTGEVEQLARGGNKILEVRLEHRFDPPKILLKGKRLRLYFAEPAYPELIVFLLLEPKDASQFGLNQQNRHIDESLLRADDWWSLNNSP
ncbi:Uncharacterised protein [Trueperella bialowiezensis]|uniref:Uncharacterized protein n=2 Tax=Trueperella bialowiezensis TaxID=312285 RepID=A0A3S4V6T5_9ACTO|nr:Uncharacterised protein [Trueperella bialowiezensis]